MAASIPIPPTFTSTAPRSDQPLAQHLSFSRNPSFVPSSPLQQKPQFPRSLSYSITNSNSSACYSHGSSSGSISPPDDRGWDASLLQLVKCTAQKFDHFVKSSVERLKDLGEMASAEDGKTEGSGGRGGEVEDRELDWDWDRWMKHFREVEEQERLISVLKSQLDLAVDKEDYADAARLKVAVATVSAKDTIGRVMSYLNRAIEEERYADAAFVRDNAGAGLVGWWAGISEDGTDPYGFIVRISAEHGRYIARSYSARQLATDTSGSPLFEIFLTVNKKGEYKHQAVYLKPKTHTRKSPLVFPETVDTRSMDGLNPSRVQSDIFDPPVEDVLDSKERDDLDVVDEQFGFQKFLQDIIPGVDVDVEVLRLDDPQTVDLGSEPKMIEKIIEEDYVDSESELNNADIESRDKIGEEPESGMHSGRGVSGREDGTRIDIDVVFGGPMPKAFSVQSTKDKLRVPARLERRGCKSFCFIVENVNHHRDSASKDQPSMKRKAKSRGGPRRAEHVVLDLIKFIGTGEKIPQKLLKDVKDLIISSRKRAQYRQLIGSTTFNRIELPAFPDPLNGLYIGSHGSFTSEVIQLRHKYGQWQGGHASKVTPDIEFYEYVEAVKLTGDPYLPAGQVAFRAKVGRGYELPHKGIIPKEFGVIARYKGQGRVAEPGFQNPRWVDGELIILDGKHIKSGPVIGFVYWDPQYQLLVFFNRLRLEQ